MRKSIIAMLAAAAVLVVGGAIGAIAQTDTTTTTEATDTEALVHPGPHGPDGAHFANLLDEMVTDGVITDTQAADITAWLKDRRATMEADRQAMRAAFDSAWADGVLTTEEARSLGGDGPMLDPNGPLAEAWADGQLTTDELQAFHAEQGGPRMGHRGGFGRFHGDTPPATDSSPGA